MKLTFPLVALLFGWNAISAADDSLSLAMEGVSTPEALESKAPAAATTAASPLPTVASGQALLPEMPAETMTFVDMPAQEAGLRLAREFQCSLVIAGNPTYLLTGTVRKDLPIVEAVKGLFPEDKWQIRESAGTIVINQRVPFTFHRVQISTFTSKTPTSSSNL